MVAIFEILARSIDSARAEIDRHQNFAANTTGPFHKFVRAELVGFDGFPGKVQSSRAFVFRTDTVFPVVTGNEIAAGIAEDRN